VALIVGEKEDDIRPLRGSTFVHDLHHTTSECCKQHGVAQILSHGDCAIKVGQYGRLQAKLARV
jgi:hypothetical protein